MILYHATLERNVPSILKHGLRVSDGRKKSFKGSLTKGLLFLAKYEEDARSMVEEARKTYHPSDTDAVVIFEIDSKDLREYDLAPDRNIFFDGEDLEVFAFEYPHDIPARFLKMRPSKEAAL